MPYYKTLNNNIIYDRLLRETDAGVQKEMLKECVYTDVADKATPKHT